MKKNIIKKKLIKFFSIFLLSINSVNSMPSRLSETSTSSSGVEKKALTFNQYDVLIIGSGPVGATYARTLFKETKKKILMIDMGAQVSLRRGENAKNFYVYNCHEDGLNFFSRKVQAELIPVSQPVENPWPETLDPIASPAVIEPPYYYPINQGNPDQKDWENMPAAASSFIVGGMGTHWTCCTPRPYDDEKEGLMEKAALDEEKWNQLFSSAEKILKTNQNAFESSLRGQCIRSVLSREYDQSLPEGRRVQMLPLACERQGSWVQWTGTDTILGDLADSSKNEERFELWSEHLCRKLNIEEGKIVSADIEDLRKKQKKVIKAKVFIVAANAFNTPQLLWNSNIRPQALGHYMCDQPMVFCQVTLKEGLVVDIADQAARTGYTRRPNDLVGIPSNDPTPNVWIPYSRNHPFQCQIHKDAFPYGTLKDDIGIDRRTIVELRWFTKKVVDFQNHVSFSEKYQDIYDMPQITIHYNLNREDKETVHQAIIDISKAAQSLGGYVPGYEPRCLPRGSSLHVTGTVRMGNDPQVSVCNKFCQVWGYENLYLGGNGIIPNETACNPTLTSVALALLACDQILAEDAAQKCVGC